MALSHPLKNLPSPLRTLVRPMLFISLALHGVFLFAPLSLDAEKKPEPPPEEEQRVNLTQLPPVNQPVAQPSPAAVRRPAQPPSPTRRLPSQSVVRPRPAAPPPVRSQRRPPPPATTGGNPTTPVQPASPPPAPPANAFDANFPRYPGTQPGSFGLPATYDPFSQKTTDAIDRVDSFYRRELQAKGYNVDVIQSDPVRLVLQVSQGETTKYLTLLPNPEGSGTSILLSGDLLPDDLGSLSVVTPEEQTFYSDLGDIFPAVDPNIPDWVNLSDPQTHLSQPEAFFANLGSGIDDGNFIEPQLLDGIERAALGSGQDSQTVFNELVTKLQNADFAVEEVAPYGGGTTYKVSRDGVDGYLSLVPTIDGTGTAVFLWQRSPI